MSNQPDTFAEATVTQPHVVAGLGYPAGYAEISAEPTGWQGAEVDSAQIDEDVKVSRETF